MNEVIFAINRFFKSNISIEKGALENCRLTANFKDKSPEAVMRIIEKTLEIQSKRTKDGIIFYGKCE